MKKVKLAVAFLFAALTAPVFAQTCDVTNILRTLFNPCTHTYQDHYAIVPGGAPAGTTYTWTVDGVQKQSGTSASFRLFYNQYSFGTHTLCVQITCPANCNGSSGFQTDSYCTTFTRQNVICPITAGPQEIPELNPDDFLHSRFDFLQAMTSADHYTSFGPKSPENMVLVHTGSEPAEFAVYGLRENNEMEIKWAMLEPGQVVEVDLRAIEVFVVGSQPFLLETGLDLLEGQNPAERRGLAPIEK